MEYKLDLKEIIEKENAGKEEKDFHELTGIEGYLIIGVPKMRERIEISKTMQQYAGDETKVIELAEYVSSEAPKHIKGADIKFQNVEIKSAEDIEYYEFGALIINLAWPVLIGGIPKGKN